MFNRTIIITFRVVTGSSELFEWSSKRRTTTRQDDGFIVTNSGYVAMCQTHYALEQYQCIYMCTLLCNTSRSRVSWTVDGEREINVIQKRSHVIFIIEIILDPYLPPTWMMTLKFYNHIFIWYTCAHRTVYLYVLNVIHTT